MKKSLQVLETLPTTYFRELMGRTKYFLTQKFDYFAGKSNHAQFSDELEKRPTRILISCGWTTGNRTSKSGMLSLRQNAQGSLQATYEPVHDYFKPMCGGFGVNCNGRIICGAGSDGTSNHLKKVFEFSNKNFVEIKPITTERSMCSSLYIPPDLENNVGLLLVAGSSFGEGSNTMEYLMINNDLKINNWNVCDDKLPCSVRQHQMSLLHNKLILTGGLIDLDPNKVHIQGIPYTVSSSNKVWQGIISFNPELRVNWSPLPPMVEDREDHVAIVIKDKLFCIGGDSGRSIEQMSMDLNGGSKSSEYFSFENNRWKKGPDLPFDLVEAKAILTNQQNQCYLFGGKRDGEESTTITVFDPMKGIENIEGCFDIPRSMHIAVLI